MEGIATFIGGIVSQVADKFDLGMHGSLAATILIFLLGITIAGAVVRFCKKKIGTLLTIVLVVAIILGAGILSLSQFKNFAQSAGMIYQDGLPDAAEKDGTWILEMFKNTAPGKEEGAGTWVPDRHNPDKW